MRPGSLFGEKEKLFVQKRETLEGVREEERMLRVHAFVRGAAIAATAAFTTLMTVHGAMAEDVNVRFSWKLKGEYGFFYLAQKEGLYEKAGLNVRFGEGAGAQAALGALIQGQEDIAVVPGIFAVTAIQKGMPVKIVALYQPAAPVVLISHADNPVKVPADMEGKSIASAVGETSTAYLGVFCAENKIECGKINKIQMDAQTRIPQFLQKKVDVVGVYRTSDLPVLKEKATEEFATLDLPEYGLKVPGLALVVSAEAVEKNAAKLREFLAATRQGIEHSKKDPQAATAALKAVWQAGPSDSVIQEQIEATSVSIEQPEGKPVGWVEETAITDALTLIASVEDIGEAKPTETFYSNELLSQ